MSPDIHTLQEAAIILHNARINVAPGSLAVWRKVDSALRYINSQIEVELEDVGNDPLFTVDIADEELNPLESEWVNIRDEQKLVLSNGDCVYNLLDEEVL